MRLFVYGRNEARPGENRPVTKYVPAVITLDRGPTCAPVPVPVLSELPNRRLMRTTRFWEVRARRCKGNFTSLRYPLGDMCGESSRREGSTQGTHRPHCTDPDNRKLLLQGLNSPGVWSAVPVQVPGSQRNSEKVPARNASLQDAVRGSGIEGTLAAIEG